MKEGEKEMKERVGSFTAGIKWVDGWIVNFSRGGR